MKRTRLQRLAERHERRASALRSTYLCVQSEDELPGKLAELARMGYSFAKVYVGIDIDEAWDNETPAASVTE